MNQIERPWEKVHLQWFAEEPAEAPAEPVEDGPEVFFEGDEGAAVEEPAELKGLSREDVFKKLQEAQTTIEAERARSQGGVGTLTDALRGLLPQTPAQSQPAVDGFRLPDFGGPQLQPGETAEAYRRRMDTEFIQRPAEVAQQIAVQSQAPMIKMMGENMLMLSREFVRKDPTDGKVYEKYQNEVERYVASVPIQAKLANPMIYRDAVQAVKAAHMTEFVEEAAAEKAKAMFEEFKKEIGYETPADGSSKAKPVFTGANPTGSRPPAAASRERVVIPQWFVAQMATKGIDEPDLLKDAWLSRPRNG